MAVAATTAALDLGWVAVMVGVRVGLMTTVAAQAVAVVVAGMVVGVVVGVMVGIVVEAVGVSHCQASCNSGKVGVRVKVGRNWAAANGGVDLRLILGIAT